jgi:hypothetical protein
MSIHKQAERLKRFFEALLRGGMTGRQFRELGPYAPAGYNANSFWGKTIEEQIQNGANKCHDDAAKWLFLPDYMSGYNPNLVTIPGDVTIIKEGDIGNFFSSLVQITEVQTVLDKWVEIRTRMRGINDGDSVLCSEFLGETRFSPYGATTATSSIWTAASGTTDSFTFHIVDGRHCFKIKSATPATAGASRNMRFRPHSIAAGVPARVDFRDTFGSVASPTVDQTKVPSALATVIQAWIRKETGPDATSALFTFGFSDAALTFPSKTISRCGLVGDGVTGFRFGSVNCPDGFVSGDNGATDIDANSLQPSSLESPGTNWFHVAIKLVPPTPTASGRWGAYLNGVLQATFTTSTNFPRGSQGTDRGYAHIEPSILYFGSASQLPGILIDDLRVSFTEDFTL